jgi:glycosyltransferase involved in cell wall biosynthesis
VILTDVASLPEIVEDGVTGFLVPPNNPEAIREKLQFLFDNPGTADEMGRRGREKVLSKFTWELTAQRCLHAYKLL